MAKKKEALSPEELMKNALVPESEWPYEVPDNWVWTRLGNITVIVGGGTPSSKIKEYFFDGNIPWITPADLSGYTNMYISNGRRNITELGLKKSSAKIVPKNTVLLSSRAPIGYVAIADNQICTNQGFKNLLPSTCFISIYMYFYLKYSKELLISKASGTTFLELSGGNASKVEFPLPPLTEQQRIVDRIESLFEKIDQAKGLIQNVIDSYENRKSAILHKAFTGELTKKWREENGIVMDSWEERDLIDSITFIKEKFDPKFNKERMPYIGLEHISKNRGINSIGDSRDVKSLKTIFGKQDILYGKLRPYLNKHDISKFIGICSTDILVMRVRNNSTPKYINYLFDRSIFIDYAVTNSKGINLPRISEKKVSGFRCFMPTIIEQKEIVKVLDELFEKEKDAFELYDLIENIDLMKKSILARAFRGELGTNDPEEESAIELLKMVLLNKTDSKSKSSKRQKRINVKEIPKMSKDILDILKTNKKLTPEKLKDLSGLETDDFYEALKKYVNNDEIKEVREGKNVFLEATHED